MVNLFEFVNENRVLIALSIKLVVIVSIGYVLFGMIDKYRKKPSKPKKVLIFVFLFWLLTATFSSFNQILGWSDWPKQDSYFGFYLALIFWAVGNIFYTAFLIEVFYPRFNRSDRLAALLVVGIIEVSANVTALILGLLLNNEIATIPVLVHFACSGVIYFLLWKNAWNTAKETDNEETKYKCKSIGLSALFCILTMVFLTIDLTFFTFFSVYNIFVWLSFTLISAYLYRAYIR